MNNELVKYLLSFGYNINQANCIINAYGVIDLKDETKLKQFKEVNMFFKSNGYKKEEIIRMIDTIPQLYCLSVKYLQNKLEFLINLGYDKKEIKK